MKRILLATAVALSALTTLSAQEKFRPYGFLQLQGGVGTTFTNVDQNKLLSPTFTVGVGAMVIPQLGLRVGVNGWQSKGGFRSIDDKYKFNYINADVDLLLNLCNLFTRHYRPHLFDVSLVAGIGINHAWGNNISTLPLAAVQENISNIWGDNLAQQSYNGTSFRMGLMFDFRLSRHWQLGLEADMNAMGDDWNAKYQQHKRDWMLTTQLSLTYRFGLSRRKAQTAAPVAPPVVTPVPPTPQPKAVPAERIVTKTVEAPLNEALQNAIRETDVNNTIIIDKVAAWSQQHPQGRIIVEGYADKGTGTPDYNMKLAQQRADKVAQALKSKGVPASQITVTAYGDTKQPFADNAQNRCVIIVGK